MALLLSPCLTPLPSVAFTHCCASFKMKFVILVVWVEEGVKSFAEKYCAYYMAPRKDLKKNFPYYLTPSFQMVFNIKAKLGDKCPPILTAFLQLVLVQLLLVAYIRCPCSETQTQCLGYNCHFHLTTIKLSTWAGCSLIVPFWLPGSIRILATGNSSCHILVAGVLLCIVCTCTRLRQFCC